MNKIGDFLHEKNMTQAELAKTLQYDLSYINQIVNGKRRVTNSFRWRWQEAFGTRALRVLNGEDENAKP